MRHPIHSAVVAVVVSALFVTAYAQRVRLADAWRSLQAASMPAAVSYNDVTLLSSLAPSATAESSLPKTVNLAVPFTPQAPFANWDAYHEDACEEASVIMVDRFYRGDAPGRIDPQLVETEIHRLTNLEDRLFGGNLDTTVMQTSEIAKQLYGYNRVEIVSNPTVAGIKAALAAGHPVIVPAAGRELGNPFFTAPGPIYHMIVLRGYTSTGFIANDPGTRRGENFEYAFDVLMKAMHDWNSTNIDQGAKSVLIVYPNK